MDDLDIAPDAEARYEFIGLESLPHLSAGTSIATVDGPVPAGWLRAGDMVVTRDRGLQPVLAVGLVETDRAEMHDNPDLWPVEIAPGALGQGNPAAPLIASPGQRILMRGAEVQLNFGLTEAFVAADHLVGWPGIAAVRPDGALKGYQILFDRHEVILADGQWTESLFLDGDALNEVRAADPQALLRFGGHRKLARPELSAWEASLLTPPREWIEVPMRATA